MPDVSSDGSGEARRRPFVASVLSAVVPGTGQWYAGRMLRGILFFVPAVVLLGALVALAGRGRIGILRLAVRPAFIWLVLAVNLVVLVWRLVATLDAYHIAGGGLRTRRPVVIVALAVIVAAVVLPHVVVASYGLQTIGMLQSVFAGNGGESGQAASAITTPSGPTTSPAPVLPDVPDVPVVPDPATRPVVDMPADGVPANLIFRAGFGDPDAVPLLPDILMGAPVTVKTLMPVEERNDLDRITILLAGGDGGPGRSGMRTDTIMVASFDVTTGKAVIFGIPRNLVQVPLRADYADAFIDLEKRITPKSDPRWVDTDGDGKIDAFRSCLCFPDQINAIYPFTRKWTTTYPDEPDPGMATLRNTLELMLGIHIDYYALVNMSGFVRLVDALGGVRVYVTGHVQAQVSPAREGEDWITIDLAPGWHHLNGHEALAYARDRKTSSDYVRMRRQRCMLKAVAAKATPVTVARRFGRIVRAIKASVRTDVPLDAVPDLIEQVAGLNFSDIATVGFGPPDYAPTSNHRGQPIPDLDAIRAEVRRLMSADATTEFATGRESECRI